MGILFGAKLDIPSNLHLRDTLYDDSDDMHRHADTICALADETHRSAEEIAFVYEEVLTLLKPQARVPDYLPVLVSKRVKDHFRRLRH
jgi:hypothetical protein